MNYETHLIINGKEVREYGFRQIICLLVRNIKNELDNVWKTNLVQK